VSSVEVATTRKRTAEAHGGAALVHRDGRKVLLSLVSADPVPHDVPLQSVQTSPLFEFRSAGGTCEGSRVASPLEHPAGGTIQHFPVSPRGEALLRPEQSHGAPLVRGAISCNPVSSP